MTLSERYQLKLDRYRLKREQSQAGKLERHKAKLLRRKQIRDLRQKARYRDSRLHLLRLQQYRCAICRRHRDECGKRGLIADCFSRQVVRGLLCSRCNRMLAVHGDNQFAIAQDEKLPYKIRKNAVDYLENWPSQKLEYMLYRQSPDPQLA